ncbi:MAG: DUF3000 family protein [Actinobacteria bacterium]|jgi:hypothetical protein|uniref:Unannotated protein n=1 Tax=freshwater metagenome TaxID=449393 RepID=A0A6J6CEE4_9ZZZZ|nr:DUF3000 family protein [Actinomycetota bacterium]
MSGKLAGSSDGAYADDVDGLFRALRGFRPRPEIEIEEIPAPAKLASHGFAMLAECFDGELEVANGRFVLLHEPGGQETWGGDLRAVTFIKADIEQEMGSDPLLPQVGWSWFEESLSDLDASHLSGTVTLALSSSFGELADRASQSELEIRASWTLDASTISEVLDHVERWTELLAHCAGLPPLSQGDGISTMVRRNK